jgi:hypothetical protein
LRSALTVPVIVGFVGAVAKLAPQKLGFATRLFTASSAKLFDVMMNQFVRLVSV